MKNRQLLSLCLIVLTVITAAVLYGEDRLISELRPSPLRAAVPQKETVTVQGRVYRVEPKSESQALYLKDNSIQYQKKKFQESKIIIYADPDLQINMGNIVRAEGRVSFFQEARNPGNFDQKRYYQIQGIHCQVRAKEVRIMDSCVWKWRKGLADFRSMWKEALVSGLGREDGATMGAMLLGEKAEMDQGVKTLYQVNGIGHILAISGLHLSFIGIGMYKILRRITGSYPVGGVFGILFLVLYILMIGFTISAVRAFTMFLFRVGADMTGRHYDAPTALSVAAVAVLLWRPLSLYDGGFWLSFGAVFAILMVVPVMEAYSAVKQQSDGVVGIHGSGQQSIGKMDVHNSKKQQTDSNLLSAYLKIVWEYVGKWVLRGLTASIGINLVILPILLYYFFEFPLYSFILNLFVIPLMSVLLFLGMAGSLLALWFAPVSVLLFWICSKILWIYKVSCETTLGLPRARLVIGRPDMWQIAVYYGFLFLGLILLRYIILSAKESGGQDIRENQGLLSYERSELRKNDKDRRKERVMPTGSIDRKVRGKTDRYRLSRWFVAFLWVTGIVILTTHFGETGKLTAVVLDVGQGDGIFMRGPEGGTYLVDGGSSDVNKVGQYRLEPFLKSQGVGMLDYVLISHGDNDHMNGVEELIERQNIGVKIGTLVLPVKEVWDEALEELARKARNRGIRVVMIEPGLSIREGEMMLTCIQPGNMEIKSEDAESRQENAVLGTGSTGLESGNEASMVLAVQYGEFDMLLTGDVEGEGEMQLIKQLEESYLDCTWEVLKVAHHGSKNSSTEEFLRKVQPAYAFISAGQENRYGHPHQEVVKRLAGIGSRIYSTQENGAIIVGVEGGEKLRMERWQR